MRRIDLETGDITTNERVFFHIIKDAIDQQGHENIDIGDNEASTFFPTSQWSLFLDQLKDAWHGRTQMSFWQQLFSKPNKIRNLKNYPTPPLGSNGMKFIINRSTISTPRYQLFFATIDLADKFFFEKDEKKYAARCLVSVGMVQSRHGGKGVFLIDNDWLGDKTEELVDGNRLCKLTFDNEIVRYYIPYAVPFQPELSEQASKAWDKIRDYYYYSKFPAG